MKGMRKICGGLLCLALLMCCLGSLAKIGTVAENSNSAVSEEMISGGGVGSENSPVLPKTDGENDKFAEKKPESIEKCANSEVPVYDSYNDATRGGATATDVENITEVQTAAGLAPPSTAAACAALMDGTGDTLFAKEAERKAYPASTTKIMTALVVLETLDELGLGIDSEIIVPQEAVGIEGSSIYLKKGERLSIEELLYGLMLQSGNDSAAALAMCVGGSLSDFVRQMNTKAAELGCTGTHFTNPSGLYDENHYTTAADLARIAHAAMQREDFRRIVSAKTWQSKDSSRSFYNKNKTIHQYEGATGVKIGFTKASGRTLVAAAERNGEEMIAVVLRDGNWFQDAYALMDYGFALKGQRVD